MDTLTPTPAKANRGVCKNCKHWKNNQRMLNYHSHIGFCLNPIILFSVNGGRIVGVIDESNMKDQSKVNGNPSHDFEAIDINSGTIQQSRYKLQTDKHFGCNLFQEK